MAQLLAQQRAISALLTPQPVAPTPSPLFCLLCSQHFPNQQIFALHMYTTHMSHNTAVETKPIISPGLAPIKTEESSTNPGSVCDSSSTLSSCAPRLVFGFFLVFPSYFIVRPERTYEKESLTPLVGPNPVFVQPQRSARESVTITAARSNLLETIG